MERMAAGGARSQKTLGAARKAYEQAQARASREDASLTTAKTAIKATQKAIERAKLVSPVAGTIVARAAEVGREVSAGGESLFLVTSDLSIVNVEARVDAAFAQNRRLGETILFGVDSIPDRQFQGKVIQMSQAPKARGAGEISLILVTINSDRLLPPGASVRVRFWQSMAGS